MKAYCSYCGMPLVGTDYVPTPRGLLCSCCWNFLQELRGEGNSAMSKEIVENLRPVEGDR